MASGNLVRFGSQFDDKVSGPLDRLKGKFDTLGKTKGFQSVAQGLGMGVGIAAWGALSNGISAATDFIGGSIEKASDLNETMSKTEAIFGLNTRAVVKWGETAADNFGMSKKAALDAASGYAGLFQTLGVGGEQASEMSMKLTQHAADLASFFNTDMETALASLKSGLSGEAEPLKKFNIFISEARVKTKAYEMGLVEAGAELGEQEKALARYAIIMEDSNAAAGDFAKTQDGLANSTRTATAKMEDLEAELGQKLLPVQQGVMQGGIDLLNALNPIFDSMQGKWTPETEALAIALGTVSFEEGKAKIAAMEAAEEHQALNETMLRMYESVPPAAAEAVELTSEELEKLGAEARDKAYKAAVKWTSGWRDGMVAGQDSAVSDVVSFINKQAETISDPQQKQKLQDEVDDWISDGSRVMSVEERIDWLERGRHLGESTVMSIAEGVGSADPYWSLMAQNADEGLDGATSNLRRSVPIYGLRTGEAYVQGIADGIRYNAAKVSAAVSRYIDPKLRAMSPPGPESPLHQIDKWGFRTADAYLSGMEARFGGDDNIGLGNLANSIPKGGSGWSGGGGGGPQVVVNIGDFHGTTDNIEELNRRLGETVRAATLRRN